MDFKNKYDREALMRFYQDEFLPEDFQPRIEPVKLSVKCNHIKDLTLLGETRDWGLKVYEIRHTSPRDPRVSLTKETFRIMKTYNHTQVLALYTSPGTGNYRLSYVTLGFTPDDRKVRTVYSNPHRYSYFLGPDATVHTPTRFLGKKGRVGSLEDLKERFSVEVVNKEFYREIATLFTQLVGGKRKEGRETAEYQPLLKLPTLDDPKKLQEFAVRLIGRVVFGWFLKKKTVPGGQPLISEEILSLKAVQNNRNYYHTILEKLFFQALNTPADRRREEFKTGPFADIPFLNGGLFEPQHGDIYELDPCTGFSRHNNTLIVPDEWLRHFFTLLETYHFTIDENTSMDVELSVDPEMLGRIFENLLAEINPETGETARKSTGSYYTPRPIVEYMVDESLKQYLETKTAIDEQKLDHLLSFSLDIDELDGGERISEEEKRAIIDALDQVKIIDPACGSGAFPMGILQKLVLILEKVDPGSEKWLEKHLEKVPYAFRRQVRQSLEKENVAYIHKMGLIRHAIYGVDVQQIAVEISKLRVFLALVVDACVADTGVDDSSHGNNRGIKPLPNLEFKFVCADSLVRLPEDRKTLSGGLFEAREDIKQLKDLREQYFDSFGPEKEDIKAKFKQTQDQMFKQMLEKSGAAGYMGKETIALSSWKPFDNESSDWFEPDWMFGIKSGFDIVISNPPYIRQEILGDKKVYYKDHYHRVYHGVADIYVYFVENGMNMLKAKGVYCIIVANKWMRANYGEPLRKFLKQRQLVKLVDFGDLPVFQNTTTYPCILVVANIDRAKPFDACNVETLELSDLKGHLESRQFKLDPGHLQDSGWLLAGEKLHHLMEKIKSAGIPLGEYVEGKIFYGIKTGLNEAFVIDEATKNRLIAEDPASAELIKPFLAGRDIKRYQKLSHRQYLIFTRQGMDIKKYPAIEKHLLKYKDRLTPKPKDFSGGSWTGRKPGPYRWYEIQDTIAYHLEFEKPKIIYPNICQRPEFTFDETGLYTNQKCFIIPVDDKYLLGILNSKLSFFIFRQVLPKLRGDFFEPGYKYMKDIPIPRMDLADKAAKAQYDGLASLVEQMLELQQELQNIGDNPNKESLGKEIEQLDEGINQLVYRLYGLNQEEIALVERETGGKI